HDLDQARGEQDDLVSAKRSGHPPSLPVHGIAPRFTRFVPRLRSATMRTADHTLQTADGPMRLYEALPEGTPKGGVIVIMEAFGVNDHIEDVTRRAAVAGYHAVSPDLFHRSGGGVAAYDDFAKVMELFGTVTDAGVLTDVDAAIDHLRKAGFADSQIGIVG